MSAGAELERARSLLREKRLQEAEEAYRRVLAVYPSHPEANYRLAQLAAQRGDWSQAAQCAERGLAADGANAALHALHGMALERLGRTAQAEDSLRRAVAARPDLPEAAARLGELLLARRAGEEAAQSLRHALALRPDNVQWRNNLGVALRQVGKLDEAIAAFRQSLALRSDYLHAQNNLAAALWQAGQMDEAVAAYGRSIALAPQDFVAHFELGSGLLSVSRSDLAIPLLQRAVALEPRHLYARLDLASALEAAGRAEEARESYRDVLHIQPDNLTAQFATRLLLPPIYHDAAHVAECRAEFERGLDELEAILERFQGPQQRIVRFAWSNASLAFQGGNDRSLQERCGRLVTALYRRALPQFLEPLPADPAATQRRLRVGFAGRGLRQGVLGLYFKSWITDLDPERFEVFYYRSWPQHDVIVEEILRRADHSVRLAGGIAGAGEQIRGDRLDVLILPAVGPDPGSNHLASLRLAPLQCAGWGHPVTTGLANVDCFLSSAWSEPAQADEHYSETLVRLAAIGTRYERPAALPPASRSEFGLPERRTLYVNPQTLRKIHPDHDALMLKILQRDDSALLLLFEAHEPEVTSRLRRRMAEGMAARGLDAQRLRFLPRLAPDRFRQFLAVCDVFLDTPHWSGGNSSLDAISCGLPIVTLPGALMRGRQTLGMLEAMGIGEGIARDDEDYVEKALALGSDAEARRSLAERMRERSNMIFDRSEPVQDLARFLLQRFGATG
jgi:CRISPR-associated protein Csy1